MTAGSEAPLTGTVRASALRSTAARTPPAPPPALPWSYRIREMASAYLPLLMMGVLALATWWLVENAPVVEPVGPAKPARHIADYTMSGFSVRRFAPNGRLRAQIEGDVMRHYPDTDTIEVDNARIRSYADDGRETLATARQAVSNGDGSEVQLLGGAEVIRAGLGATPPIEFRGEFLHAFLEQEVLRSHLPVVVRRGTAELRANGLNYRHADQKLELNGRVRAIFPPAGRRTEPR